MILLAEDDEDVREMLAFTLSSRGFTVETVTDGSAAMAAIMRQRPCLVILDLVMPVMTGQEVLEQMKAQRLDDIPVCVMSAVGGPTPVAAVATLPKPFDVADVVSIAAKYCSHVSRAPDARG